MALAGSGLTRPEVLPAAELLAALPTALLLLDTEGRVRDANAAAEDLLNLSAATLRGRPLADHLVLPLDYVARTGSESALALYDVPLMTTRGLRFRADFIVTPIADRPGWRLLLLQQGANALGLGLRMDKGARAAVGAAAMLAHEIKNPLSGIRGAAQLIEAEVRGEARELMGLIRREVDRIAALIDGMQRFTDERPLDVSAENIYPILDDVRRIAASGFALGLSIVENYDPSLPPVFAHRDSLTQVLLNLLKNAAEALEEKGRIEISTAYRLGVSVARDDGKRVSLPIEICITDNGPGVPEDIVDHLFDPFVTTKRTGQGLGLALADKLMRDMGGMIQYAREEERTVFRLLLPRAK